MTKNPSSPFRPPTGNFFFFFNDTATTEIYTFPYTTLFRSHDDRGRAGGGRATADGHRHGVRAGVGERGVGARRILKRGGDRKSTRLNSSHLGISYAVFCLKKKKKHRNAM